MAPITVTWTGPAKQAVELMKAADFDGQNPKKWHVKEVQNFAANNTAVLPGVKRAKIRAPLHSGGRPNDPNADPDPHITVWFKTKDDVEIVNPKTNTTGWHVYPS